MMNVGIEEDPDSESVRVSRACYCFPSCLMPSCKPDCLEHSWDWGVLERSENHPGGGAFITSGQNGMACVREAAGDL